MRLSIALAAIFLSGANLTVVRAESAAPPLRLVPTPRQLTRGEGSFVLSGETTVALQSTDPADKLAAEQLIAEAKTDLGLDLKMAAEGQKDAAIVLERKSINLPAEAIAEGYTLKVGTDHVDLQASTSAGLFYGVQTLKQLIRANAKDHGIPAVEITDWPLLRYRGWQDDISRGPIPTLDFLKQEVRTMAEVKANFFTLYTEHVFKLEKHPEIAPPDGITAEEMRELSAYAKRYHVELAGNFQSFGHFANILKLPKYAPLGANKWALDPANEAAYSFLNDAYSEIAPAYPSPLFCISCDEVGNLGKPDVQAMIKRWGPGGVYAYHINRVTALLAKYGKTPMMWGDIALEHPEDIAKLPRNLIVLPWTYGDSGKFDGHLKPYADNGYRTMVCPGVNCWNRLWPAVDVAAHNISDFTRDGYHYNTLGQLDTMWRDSGETLFGGTFYPLFWGAECAWSPVTDQADRESHAQREAKRNLFDDAFDGVFYGLSGSAVAQANRDLGARVLDNPVADGNDDRKFWTDPTVAHAEAKGTKAAEDLVAMTNKVIATAQAAKGSAKYNAYTLDEMVMEAKRIRFLGQRVLVVDALPKNPEAWKDLLANLDAVRAEFTRLWHVENRDWWLSHNMEKFDELEKTIKALPTQVSLSPVKPEFTADVAVTITPLSAGEVHYTLDGSEPTAQSPVYSEPITLHKTTTVKARNLINGEVGPVASATYAALRLPAVVRTRMKEYQDHSAGRAFDGSDESFFWAAESAKTGDWLTVVLDTPTKFKKIEVRTGHPTTHGDILEHGVLEVSDGEHWTKLADFKDGVAKADGPAEAVKSIRVKVTEDQHNWLAIQEIDVE